MLGSSKTLGIFAKHNIHEDVPAKAQSPQNANSNRRHRLYSRDQATHGSPSCAPSIAPSMASTMRTNDVAGGNSDAASGDNTVLPPLDVRQFASAPPRMNGGPEGLDFLFSHFRASGTEGPGLCRTCEHYERRHLHPPRTT